MIHAQYNISQTTNRPSHITQQLREILYTQYNIPQTTCQLLVSYYSATAWDLLQILFLSQELRICFSDFTDDTIFPEGHASYSVPYYSASACNLLHSLCLPHELRIICSRYTNYKIFLGQHANWPVPSARDLRHYYVLLHIEPQKTCHDRNHEKHKNDG